MKSWGRAAWVALGALPGVLAAAWWFSQPPAVSQWEARESAWQQRVALYPEESRLDETMKRERERLNFRIEVIRHFKQKGVGVPRLGVVIEALPPEVRISGLRVERRDRSARLGLRDDPARQLEEAVERLRESPAIEELELTWPSDRDDRRAALSVRFSEGWW